MSEGVFDFGPCLFGVARELIDASLGAQPGVAGGAAEVLLGGALDRLDFVSREEFDIQVALLARTREKLEALEERLASLEGRTKTVAK